MWRVPVQTGPQPATSAPSAPDCPAGTRKMEYKGSSWHEACFVCYRCQQPIGTKSFIPRDGQNFCVPCYEEQHALQCVQCKKVCVLPGPAHAAARGLGLLTPVSFQWLPAFSPLDLCSSLSGVSML